MNKYTVATEITPINVAFGQCLWTELMQACAVANNRSAIALIRAGNHDLTQRSPNGRTLREIASGNLKYESSKEAAQKILAALASVGA